MENYDLNRIFPEIGRTGDAHDEGRYYDVLRLSPRPTVISGGQSGIDSAGLRAASFLGLPAFAIMPRGGRREGESIEAYAARTGTILRKIELSSDSYRYRTWAGAWFADATVIFDFVGTSDGTKCAAEACQFFSRPCLILRAVDEDAFQTLDRFLSEHAPEVINVAGNSMSKITPQIADAVYAFLKRALRRYAFLRAGGAPHLPECAEQVGPLRVAVPSFGVSRALFADFFKERFGAEIAYDRRLTYRLGGVTLIVARPREIIRLVESGADIGFVGEDLCREYGYGGEILLRTGLIPNAMALISRGSPGPDPPRTCSQYPHCARTLTGRSVTPITGSAEAYLSLGIFDECVDSYQTGNTAAQNGLTPVRKLAESALVMIGNEKEKTGAFLREVAAWLLGQGGPPDRTE